jgi:hypothetical protein
MAFTKEVLDEILKDYHGPPPAAHDTPARE